MIEELTRVIYLSEGEFSLLLVRCNYRHLRERLVKELREQCPVTIRELWLDESVKTLYSTIREALGEEQPSALMVLGLESVEAIEEVLNSTNQVRDEFPKYCPFPLLLWITDELLGLFIRLVPDFKTWGMSFNFTLSNDELINFLRQGKDSFWTAVMEEEEQDLSLPYSPASPAYRNEHLEIETALGELANRGIALAQDLQASLEFCLGREDYFNNRFNQALEHYQQSLVLWEGEEEKRGIILFYLGLCYYTQAQQNSRESRDCWLKAKEKLQASLNSFEQVQRFDLVGRFIGQLGEVLGHLEAWDELEELAQRSLKIHQDNSKFNYNLAQDYGFLTQVALHRGQGEEAYQWGEKAWSLLKKINSTLPSHTSYIPQTYYLPHNPWRLLGWSSWLLAQGLRKLKREEEAIDYLKKALKEISPESDPKLYIRILAELRSLYYQQRQYLEAFRLKQKQREVELKFRLRAFIGAGQLQPPLELGESLEATTSMLTASFAASGRQQDVDYLVNKRIASSQYKLTVLYGQSGVGKSSLVSAGLLPALQDKAMDGRIAFPVLVRAYSDWVMVLGEAVFRGEEGEGGQGEGVSVGTVEGIRRQLRANAKKYLLTVLIFDQFEEFFFVCTEVEERRKFYRFLQACLVGKEIPFVKVILSLREDYLHNLLEFEQFAAKEGFESDILRKEQRYYLGNFSLETADSVIKQLTERAQLRLEPDLIEALVADLGEKLGEVRPIEMQVVGAQLQAEGITTLTAYRELGNNPQEELAKRWLAAVVSDCGRENEEIAWNILALLTDEKGRRPLKTATELREALVLLFPALGNEENKLAIPLTSSILPASHTQQPLPQLIIEILVNSGLVMYWVQEMEGRYQLVHDYLVEPIRQKYNADFKLKFEEEKRARRKAEREKQQAETSRIRVLKWSLVGAGVAVLVLAGSLGFSEVQRRRGEKREANAELVALSLSTNDIWTSGIQLEALLKGLITGQKIKQDAGKLLDSETRMQGIAALRKVVYGIREYNRLEGHSSPVNEVGFSPDGKTIASASSDSTVKLWKLDGSLITTLQGHSSQVYDVRFSPDGKTIASASSDSTVKLWKLDGSLITTLQGHSSQVYDVRFSPDGKTIASASSDSTVKLWKLDGSLITTLQGHSSQVYDVRFSPDGKTIASASSDSTVKLWKLDGSLITTLQGHSSRVNEVGFSPDGKTIASASSDSTVKLWKLDGSLITTLQGHSSQAMMCASARTEKLLLLPALTPR